MMSINCPNKTLKASISSLSQRHNIGRQRERSSVDFERFQTVSARSAAATASHKLRPRTGISNRQWRSCRCSLDSRDADGGDRCAFAEAASPVIKLLFPASNLSPSNNATKRALLTSDNWTKMSGKCWTGVRARFIFRFNFKFLFGFAFSVRINFWTSA